MIAQQFCLGVNVCVLQQLVCWRKVMRVEINPRALAFDRRIVLGRDACMSHGTEWHCIVLEVRLCGAQVIDGTGS